MEPALMPADGAAKDGDRQGRDGKPDDVVSRFKKSSKREIGRAEAADEEPEPTGDGDRAWGWEGSASEASQRLPDHLSVWGRAEAVGPWVALRRSLLDAPVVGPIGTTSLLLSRVAAGGHECVQAFGLGQT